MILPFVRIKSGADCCALMMIEAPAISTNTRTIWFLRISLMDPPRKVIFPSSQRRGGCAVKKMMRSHRSGADGVVRPASPRFRRTDHPGASRLPSSTRRGIPLGPTKSITVITTLAPRGVAHIHLFKLFVLNLHGQIQNGFNGA